MTTSRIAWFAVAGLLLSQHAIAQQPPRSLDIPRSVTLSLAEYNRLIDLANRPPDDPGAAPVAAVPTSADLRIRVDGDTARGAFSLTGSALHQGIGRVKLLAGATVVGASADGRPLPLVADGNAHTALVPGPGPFALTLEWGATLDYKPGHASFVLPVPQAGSARATIDVPGEQAAVRLSSGLITRRTVGNGRTVIEATLDPGAPTEVLWSMRDSSPVAAARELRTLADVMTLVTIGESEVRMVALIDVTVLQGELRTLTLRLPPGYELTSVAGASVDVSEPRADEVAVTVADSTARGHQLLVSLERQLDGDSFTIDSGLVTVNDVQRERGEVAVEGLGTLELNAAERDGMHRIDTREINRVLVSLARLPLLAAFRYQRTSGTAPRLALDVRRFPDAGVLAAVADHATATTLVTSEGRALTEILLQVQNRAQPFLKVTLPPGATMVSVAVAGEPAKPVLGADGTRVPLLRTGFRPAGPYQVSFVYLHAGTPFARKGEVQMTLPSMDLPVSIVRWEVFTPEHYDVRPIDGNVLQDKGSHWGYRPVGMSGGVQGTSSVMRMSLAKDALPGQVRGRVSDRSGAVLPGVTVELRAATRNFVAVTDGSGSFLVSGVPAGEVTVSATLPGFTQHRGSFTFDERPRQLEIELTIGALEERITVDGESPARTVQQQRASEPSQNVLNLQRRTAGVLPIRVDVPRAGTSHQFVKPLVVDQETFVRLRYKRR